MWDKKVEGLYYKSFWTPELNKHTKTPKGKSPYRNTLRD